MTVLDTHLAAGELDLDRLAEILRATAAMTEIDVALGLAELGILVVPTVPGDKNPMLTAAHIRGVDGNGEIVAERCDACQRAGLRPSADHGATIDADTVRRYWAVHPDAGVGMKVHPRLVRADGDFADAKALKQANKRIGYGQKGGDPLPFEAPTPGGQYRRRRVHVLPDGVPAPGGGTSIFGVSWYCASGYVNVTGGHPNGGRYSPFVGDRITPLPETVCAVLAERGGAGSSSGDGGSCDAATDSEVAAFLSAHNAGTKLGALERRIAMVRDAEVGHRHPTAVGQLTVALREAVAGLYPAQLAHDQLHAAFKTALNGESRPTDEWSGIVHHAVGRLHDVTADQARKHLDERRANTIEATYDEGWLDHLDERRGRDLTIDELDALLDQDEAPADSLRFDPSSGEITPPVLDEKVQAALDRIRARNLGLRDSIPPARPLIGGVIDLATMILLYARWGCYKSFLGIDWGLHVATGTPWMGHPVERRPFVILGYEAPLSLHRRARAWCKYYDIDDRELDGWFYLDRRPRPLTDRTERVAMRHYLDDIGAGFVMVDTIARASVGVKTNTDEMLVVYEALGELVTDNRTVLGVGHAGKDTSRGMRGFSGQEDWADAVFALDRGRTTGGPHGPATLTNPKQKDRDQLSALLFGLEIVDLGDGGPTSAVLVPAVPAVPAKAKRAPTVEEQALGLVLELLETEDGWQSTPTVTERCKRTGPRVKLKVQRADVAEAIDRLVQLGAVERNDQHEVRLVDGYDDE